MADSPYKTLAEALEVIINTAFNGVVVATHDNVHPALGQTQRVCGISPLYDVPRANNMAVQETWLEVKFFDFWKREIDPATVIDPRVITEYAETFRRAVQAARVTDGNDQVWFFDVMRVDYPNDPTGNKSRFVAQVRGFGNNAGLLETSG